MQQKPQTFQTNLQARLHNLTERVAQCDTQLVDLLRISTMRKRSQRLYFSAQGSLAAYKCITKSLSFEHTIHYLSLALTKHRT